LKLEAAETSLDFIGAGQSFYHQDISTATGCLGPCLPGQKQTRFVAAALSENGVCWFLQDVVTTGVVTTGVGWEQKANIVCTAANAPAYDSTTPPDRWESNPGNTQP
jgi:hypothetical protein